MPPPAASNGTDVLAYWSRAVEADTAKRNALIAEAQRTKSGWKLAMLRSLSSADAQDAVEAQAALRAQLRQGLGEDEAALTRLRIAELERAQSCMAETGELRGRLGRIVDIERQIEHGR